MKTCVKCGQLKTADNFSPHPNTKDGLRPECKPCRAIASSRWRKSNPAQASMTRWIGVLRRKFGLSEADYAAIMKSQRGGCAICGRASKIRLAVDHCHRTGRVRGLLCLSCNTAIGKLQDDPAIIQRAADYVRNQQHQFTAASAA